MPAEGRSVLPAICPWWLPIFAIGTCGVHNPTQPMSQGAVLQAPLSFEGRRLSGQTDGDLGWEGFQRY